MFTKSRFLKSFPVKTDLADIELDRNYAIGKVGGAIANKPNPMINKSVLQDKFGENDRQNVTLLF